MTRIWSFLRRKHSAFPRNLTVLSLYFFPLHSLLIGELSSRDYESYSRERWAAWFVCAEALGRRVHYGVSNHVFRLPSDIISRIRNLPTRRLSFPQFLRHVGNCRLQRTRHDFISNVFHSTRHGFSSRAFSIIFHRPRPIGRLS